MKNKPIKVGFVSLGCSKNLMDTEVMLKILADAGYEITPEESEADVVIVNTCAFIESAKRESIDSILDVAWLKENANLKAIVVTGCMAERYRDEILKEMPEVDAILGVGGIDRIAEAVGAALEKKPFSLFPDKEAGPLGGDRIVTTGDAMAYIKVAEGCNNRCAYCAIPGIRGKMRSRAIGDIVAEAKELDGMGIKELVVVAQDTSAYGLDLYGHYALPELIRALTAETSIPWIRLLYCYPDKITDELVEEIKNNPRVVKYIDIPIQHIADPVLRRMNRHGGSATIRENIAKLRTIPGIVLRSTAIVGFPGETDEDFAELCAFIKDAKFERFGAFTYSREEDTPAYDFPDQIDEQVKQDRYDTLMRTQLAVSEAYNESRIGTVVHVLCEGYDPVAESHFGRSYAEAADIDGKIWFSVPQAGLRIAEGEMIDVKITEAMDYDLVGEAILPVSSN